MTTKPKRSERERKFQRWMRKMFKPSPKQSGGFIGGCKCHSKHERCPMHGTKFSTVERR
jgi:hypothetical protein